MADRLKCPHCLHTVHLTYHSQGLGSDQDGNWILQRSQCPSCERLIFELENGHGAVVAGRYGGYQRIQDSIRWFVRPKVATRAPCPASVPEDIAVDYREACLVLTDSPKASAALSRRCLQHLLRSHVNVKPTSLADEIQQVLDGRTLPSYLADGIDAIRNIGNFASHPIKAQTTGSVVDVEPGEAEWNLDILEGLFDFYFVQPALLAEKRDRLNRKLAEAGKPPLKGS